MVYCGIDNGVTGTIGLVSNDKSLFYLTPVKLVTNYQKENKNINRIDVLRFLSIFSDYPSTSVKVFIERPMVNSTRFTSSISAVRALEATLICLEELGLGYEYVDSKPWQKDMLPSGIKGGPALKKASMDAGIRLFPQFKEMFEKHGDADGILIAEWARRNKL